MPSLILASKRSFFARPAERLSNIASTWAKCRSSSDAGKQLPQRQPRHMWRGYVGLKYSRRKFRTIETQQTIETKIDPGRGMPDDRRRTRAQPHPLQG